MVIIVIDINLPKNMSYIRDEGRKNFRFFEEFKPSQK